MGSLVVPKGAAGDSNNSDGCEYWFAAVNQCKQWAILSQAVLKRAEGATT